MGVNDLKQSCEFSADHVFSPQSTPTHLLKTNMVELDQYTRTENMAFILRQVKKMLDCL